MRSADNLVWIDLEMSGLDVERDVILEIATIITDRQLNELAQGPVFSIHQSDEILNTMDPWCRGQHGKSGLTEAVRKSTTTIEQAEEITLEFLRDYCFAKKSVLCGNSVWQDRIFLRRYMPRITDFLHYRIIDVSSVKELISHWYPTSPDLSFVKKDTHRALDDIRESIAELRHYRMKFFV